MVRITVPEDYDSGHVSVAGTADYHYGAADVNTEAVRHARDLSVREDAEGRYVGCSEHYADDVRAFLGVDETSSADEDSPEETSDAEPITVTSAGVEYAEDHIERGECPWCDDYEGDGVPQHASAAHPEDWAEYKEASD
jgi:hypothetical protein